MTLHMGEAAPPLFEGKPILKRQTFSPRLIAELLNIYFWKGTANVI